MITTAEILSAKGIVPTPQRVAVYEAVSVRRDHPTVDAVFAELRKRLPTLSKTTVYTTMQLLAEKKLIGAVHAESDEVRYDGMCQFHAHFKCKRCGKLYDISLPHAHRKAFADMPKGFVFEDEELTYYGLCPNCSTKPRKEKTK